MTGTPPPAPLVIRQLRKSYGEVVAVDGLDLEIRPGECFGLLGPNAVIDALRATMLRGAGPGQLLPELAVIATWLVVSFFLAVRLFRWR